MLTMRNDLIRKGIHSGSKKILFDQIGAGRKAFKNKWDNIFVRILVNLCLPIIMLLGDFYQLIFTTFRLIKPKRNVNIDFNRLFIGIEAKLYEITTRAKISNERDVWFRTPFDTYQLPVKRRIISAYDLLKISDVFRCSYMAIIAHILTVFKMGYDKYFLSYNSFNWFLTDCALRRIPKDVEIFYDYIYDRMAILCDKLPFEKKNMVQHGTMFLYHIDKSSPYFDWQEDMGFYVPNNCYKSSPTTVYCFTKKDEVALSRTVISNKPTFVYVGYGFKPTFKPNRKSLLIIGEYNKYGDKERIILERLEGLEIDIYLKNHPTISDSVYNDLRKRFNFKFISSKSSDFPDVDLLISYESTLAYQYESIGSKVLFYDDIDVKIIRETVSDIMKINF